MIRKIGIIYQDLNSREFLEGLRARLGCDAELVAAPSPIGMSKNLTRQQAKQAWAFFRKAGVDLVVRFTDADRERARDVCRRDLEVVPDEAKPLWICGVAVEAVEDWLALNAHYAADKLGVEATEMANGAQRIDRMKHAIKRLRQAQPLEGVVTTYVKNAPGRVFRIWLNSDSEFRRFYQDCRQAAALAGCATPNELEPDGD